MIKKSTVFLNTPNDIKRNVTEHLRCGLFLLTGHDPSCSVQDSSPAGESETLLPLICHKGVDVVINVLKKSKEHSAAAMDLINHWLYSG